MPVHIQRHSVLVARIATGLGRSLVGKGLELDLRLIERGALLHDIGKARAIETRENHAELGATIVEAAGYPGLEPIVRDHIILERYDPSDRLSESLVVNYSDKRVRHDRIVSLADRFSDLADRYARSDEARQRLVAMLVVYQQLEVELFAHLSFGPKEVEAHLAADLPLPPEGHRPR